jgi:5-methyltetrahydrofolate--homocysteine methyltransferase
MRSNLLSFTGERAVIADGAMGTELQRAGLEPGACCEAWNLEQPEKVKAIHRAYLGAGARLITTNSFRANSIALSHYGFEPRVEEFNRAAARLAREAADGSAFVMGSVGPLGGALEPAGEISSEAGFNAFAGQSASLVSAGVDAIIIETMTSADELELAARAAREAGATLIIATMAFDKVDGGYQTMAGVGVGQAVAAMSRAGADIVGCNCGASMTMDDYAKVVKLMRSHTDRPIIAQPNAGRPELIEGKIVYRQTPQEMAEKVGALIEAGAQVVGGCCGTTPEHIRLFGESLKTDKDS